MARRDLEMHYIIPQQFSDQVFEGVDMAIFVRWRAAVSELLVDRVKMEINQ